MTFETDSQHQGVFSNLIPGLNPVILPRTTIKHRRLQHTATSLHNVVRAHPGGNLNPYGCLATGPAPAGSLLHRKHQHENLE